MRLFSTEVKKVISSLYNEEIVKEVEKLPINEDAKKVVLESYQLTDNQKRAIIKSYIMDRKKSVIYTKSDEDKNILIEKKRYYYNILTAINNFDAVQAVSAMKQDDLLKYQKLIDAIDAELSSTTFVSSDARDGLLQFYDTYLTRLGSKNTKIHTQRRTNTKTIKQSNLFNDHDYKVYSLNKLANKNAFNDFLEVPADEFLESFTLGSGNNKINNQGYYTSLQLFLDGSSSLYGKIFDAIVNGDERIFGNKLKFSLEFFRYNQSKNTFEISNAIKAI